MKFLLAAVVAVAASPLYAQDVMLESKARQLVETMFGHDPFYEIVKTPTGIVTASRLNGTSSACAGTFVRLSYVTVQGGEMETVFFDHCPGVEGYAAFNLDHEPLDLDTYAEQYRSAVEILFDVLGPEA